MKRRSTVIAASAEEAGSARRDSSFFFLLVYLLLDYGRPQDFFPFIGALHPGLIIVSILFLYLVSRRELHSRCVQTTCFALLLSLMVIHGPIAVNNYWALQIFRSTVVYFIVYLSVANFVDSYAKLQRFIDSWIIINLVCATVGTLNGGKVPNSAFMGDENDFALVMNMAVSTAYFMFLQAERFKRKLFYLFATGVFVTASVASLSRGGFIGLAAVGLFCWLYSPKKLRSGMTIALLAAVLYLTAPPTYWDEMSTIQSEGTQEGTTGGERWYTWKCGWRMFLDNPIIGVGQGNFPWTISSYEPPGGLNTRSFSSRAAHSVYFTLLPELGAIGTILFFTLLGYSLKGMKVILKAEKMHRVSTGQSDTQEDTGEKLRKLKHVILGVQGALVAYFVTGIFLSVLYYPHFWVFMGFSVAIANVGKDILSLPPNFGCRKVMLENSETRGSMGQVEKG